MISSWTPCFKSEDIRHSWPTAAHLNLVSMWWHNSSHLPLGERWGTNYLEICLGAKNIIVSLSECEKWGGKRRTMTNRTATWQIVLSCASSTDLMRSTVRPISLVQYIDLDAAASLNACVKTCLSVDICYLPLRTVTHWKVSLTWQWNSLLCQRTTA